MSKQERDRKMRRNLRLGNISLFIGTTVMVLVGLYSAITGDSLALSGAENLTPLGRVMAATFAIGVGIFAYHSVYKGWQFDKVLAADRPYDQEAS